MVWNQHLKQGFRERGFSQSSKIDECLFYKGKTFFKEDMDDGILIGPEKSKIGEIFANFQRMDKFETGFEVSGKGDLSNYLGVKVQRLPNGTISLTQLHLIDSIM